MKRTKREPKPEKERVRQGTIDLTFVLVLLILLGLGIVMMFSASYAIAINEEKDGYYYALRQIIFAGAGLIAMIIISFFDYHLLAKKGVAVAAYAVSVVLLILVPIIGTDQGTGITRWIKLPGGLTFQPSELAKFAVVILFAYLIDQNFDKMKKFSTGVVPYVILVGIIVGLLMLQPHLSCSLLILMIGVTLVFVGGAKWWHILLIVLIGALAMAGLVLFLIQVKGVGYFNNRFESWLHPFDSINPDKTWQTRQSLIAIGSGGLFGLGFGESRQKYLYLPESENDFVFSIVCEELGMLGAVTVILLFGALVAQGFHIATHCKDRFGMLITIGFTLQIALQAFLNIAVVANLVPNTGISLPFFSYGGTALMMQLAQMGIVLNVSRSRMPATVRRPIPPPEEPQEPYYEQDA
ncbi:MAG: FtsW/RodA/SpoVE family cell cycle protein [Oscillospiraceae bacterium]|nr:FtsW/RodA/SpoVE family cell cycle protein [Oscillospiraceae bacterium]